MRQSHKTLALWVLLILMFWAIYQIISQEQSPKEQPEFSKFLKQVDEGNVKEVTVTLAGQGNAGTFEGKLQDDRTFKTTGVWSDSLQANLQKQGVTLRSFPRRREGSGNRC